MTTGGPNDFERLARILERHLSPIHVRSVLRHALNESKLTPAQFKLSDLAKINASLERGLRLFATELMANRAIRDVRSMCEVKSGNLEPYSIEIVEEVDISKARGQARSMCEQAGAKGFTIQKVTTIVSELARNILSYTIGGKVELVWRDGPKQQMIIRAIDRGPGISNLSLVLSGDYQSKTGLGRGLLGTKRLADSFDITTRPSGTHITVEVLL
jgi:serine/threonine-protein kinase RsbT